MKRETTSPGIGSGESYRRIREALREEKNQRWGEISRIEADLGVSDGYLAKVCRGELKISVNSLLATLERMRVDPGQFFAKALDTRVDSDWLLEEIERFGDVDSKLTEIEKATAELEAAAPTATAPPSVDAEVMVADFVRARGTEQRRRLGAGRKYCHPAFAAAYLEHLDALRYDDAREARLDAAAVAVKLVPRLPGRQAERIALQLKAIAVYASCHRQNGSWATAARALRLALGLARRQRQHEMLADLLVRAANVLSDNGRFEQAKDLLDEALVIYYDLDSQDRLGMVMVERGRTLLYLGRHQEAVGALDRSLSLLHGDSQPVRRYRLAVHQLLALVYTEMGDLEQAEAALTLALAMSKDAGKANQATVLWLHGVIALKRTSYQVAEESLREAAGLFDLLDDPNETMVSLDLSKTLLLRDKPLEAVAIAVKMAENLAVFRGNRVAEALISELSQTAIQGNLTVGAIKTVQEKLQAAFEPSGRSLQKRTLGWPRGTTRKTDSLPTNHLAGYRAPNRSAISDRPRSQAART